MFNSKKNIVMIAVMAVLILLALYLCRDDIMDMVGLNSQPRMIMPELTAQSNITPKKNEELDNQPQKNAEKSEPEIVVSNEVKVPLVRNDNGFINLEKVEDYAQSVNSMGELSDLRNQAEILKARTELTKEQVNFETEKQNLINLLTPKPLFTPEKDSKKDDEKNNELMDMIKKQQEQIDNMRDQNAVKTDETVKKAAVPALPVDNGITLLSVQKTGKSYVAVIRDNETRKIVKTGDKLGEEYISSIGKNGITMVSGKKYNF